MDMRQLITEEHLCVQLAAGSFKHVLQVLAEQASHVTGVDDTDITHQIMDRERLGSTAMGGGVMIPHARLEDLDRMYAFVATLKEPIDIESPDDQPIDIIFLLLAPENDNNEHLRALARVSRLMRNVGFVDKLRGCLTAESLYMVLTGDAEELLVAAGGRN